MMLSWAEKMKAKAKTEAETETEKTKVISHFGRIAVKRILGQFVSSQPSRHYITGLIAHSVASESD
jgi:hypothetical protein